MFVFKDIERQMYERVSWNYTAYKNGEDPQWTPNLSEARVYNNKRACASSSAGYMVKEHPEKYQFKEVTIQEK